VKRLARFVATLGPIGSFPVAPATAGSAVTVAIGWFLPVPSLWVTFALLAVGSVLAIWVCDEAEKVLGHDAKPIVADEVIGQSVALLFLPHTITAFVSAFLVFRVLDVWKPFGAREAQNLPGGFGIVADDAIAGVVSCLVLQVAWYALRRAGFGV
jgi:phosphatidylglycerophosphatase A